MGSTKNLNHSEKIELLDRIEQEEDRFFQDYTEELNELIRDSDEEIRSRAVRALWDYPTAYFLEILLDLAQNDPSPAVRHKAISALGRFIYEGSVEGLDLEPNEEILDESEISQEDFEKAKNFLFSIYNNKNKSVDERRFALEALSFSADKALEKMILKAWEDKENERFKMSALFAMARHGHQMWEKYLLAALDEEKQEILTEAIRAAGVYSLEAAGEKLLALTYADDNVIQQEAIWALGLSGWSKAFDRLNILSQSPNREIQEIAQIALEEWLDITSHDEGEE